MGFIDKVKRHFKLSRHISLLRQHCEPYGTVVGTEYHRIVRAEDGNGKHLSAVVRAKYLAPIGITILVVCILVNRIVTHGLFSFLVMLIGLIALVPVWAGAVLRLDDVWEEADKLAMQAQRERANQYYYELIRNTPRRDADGNIISVPSDPSDSPDEPPSGSDDDTDDEIGFRRRSSDVV